MSVRVAILDSGIFPGHPQLGSLAGSAVIAGEDLTDHLGHGTAVAVTIRTQAPQAELFAVKIFDRSLACPVRTLIRGLDWCFENRMHLVNLSLGTNEADPALAAAVERLLASGARIIAPAGSYPGDWPGVTAVEGSARAGSLEGSSFAVAQETARQAAES